MPARLPAASDPGPIVQEPIRTTGSIVTLQPDADGCEILLSETARPLPFQAFRLPLGNANYNAMYALLLACWINKLNVDIYRRASLAVPAPTGTNTPPPHIVTSVTGRHFTV
jgi:hypothetical protein